MKSYSCSRILGWPVTATRRCESGSPAGTEVPHFTGEVNKKYHICKHSRGCYCQWLCQIGLFMQSVGPRCFGWGLGLIKGTLWTKIKSERFFLPFETCFSYGGYLFSSYSFLLFPFFFPSFFYLFFLFSSVLFSPTAFSTFLHHSPIFSFLLLIFLFFFFPFFFFILLLFMFLLLTRLFPCLSLFSPFLLFSCAVPFPTVFFFRDPHSGYSPVSIVQPTIPHVHASFIMNIYEQLCKYFLLFWNLLSDTNPGWCSLKPLNVSAARLLDWFSRVTMWTFWP